MKEDTCYAPPRHIKTIASVPYNGEIKVWMGTAGAVAEWSSNDFVVV